MIMSHEKEPTLLEQAKLLFTQPGRMKETFDLRDQMSAEEKKAFDDFVNRAYLNVVVGLDKN